MIDVARTYLGREPLRHLPLLAALASATPTEVRMVAPPAPDEPFALALIVQTGARWPGRRPMIWLAGDSGLALGRLLNQSAWPAAVWTATQDDLRPTAEVSLGCPHDPDAGLVYYTAAGPCSAPIPHMDTITVRQLTLADTTRLDLTLCRLSATALGNWLLAGGRVFGALDGRRLLCHAMATNPLLGTEEIAAVFTTPAERGRGLAGLVVAAVAGDVVAHGRTPIYTTRRRNAASRRVAEKIGMGLLLETWEIRKG
jgi:hypothetical protein